MAESRYSTNSDSTKSAPTPVLDPNTQRSIGSSSSTNISSQFQGLPAGQSSEALKTLINTLLFGQGQATQGIVYRDKTGRVRTAEEYAAQQQQISSVRNNTRVDGTTATAQLREIYANEISPSTEAVDSSGNPIGAADFEGTTAMKEATAARKQATADLQKLLASFSPEAASKDSALAMQGVLRESLEKNMPAIQRSIEGAGTSGGAMQALLSQDLAARSAEQAAKLSLDAKAKFGDISANLAATLGQLSIQEDPVIKALLAALDAGKVSTSGQVGTQRENRSSGPIGSV